MLQSTSIHNLSIPIWISMKNDTEKHRYLAKRVQFRGCKKTLKKFRETEDFEAFENSFFGCFEIETQKQDFSERFDGSVREWPSTSLPAARSS